MRNYQDIVFIWTHIWRDFQIRISIPLNIAYITFEHIDLINIFVALKPKIYNLRVLGNTKHNLQFFILYFHNIEILK